MKYEKQFETYDQLADRLLSRGLIADRPTLVQALEEIGYYRLSGYWHIFKRGNSFDKGASLDRILDIYEFDRRLRLLTLDAIERVEIFFRSNLAHELATLGGAFGYLERVSLPGFTETQYADFIRRCRLAYGRSREPYAIHFKQCYGDEHDLPPYWILVGVLDFGTLFALYRGAPNDVRKRLSRLFGVQPKVMDSWLVALNTTRNICCHHGRLWNRTLGTRPALPRKKNDPRWHGPFAVRSDKPVAVLTILCHMLQASGLDPDWARKVVSLILTRCEEDRARMGFNSGWEDSPFWKPYLPGD